MHFLKMFPKMAEYNFDLPVFFCTHFSLHWWSIPESVVLLCKGLTHSSIAQRKICLCFSKLHLGFVLFRVTFCHFSKISFYFLIIFQWVIFTIHFFCKLNLDCTITLFWNFIYISFYLIMFSFMYQMTGIWHTVTRKIRSRI